MQPPRNSIKIIYSTAREFGSRVALCRVLLWFHTGRFAEMFQGYFAGISSTIAYDCHSTSEATLNSMGKYFTGIHNEHAW